MKKSIGKTWTLALAALLFTGSLQVNIYAEETVEETAEETYSGGELKESDELLNEYLEREITGSTSAGRRKAPRGNSLEGNDAYVYAYLKDMVTETAEGRTDSTVFALPLEEPFQSSFTKEELGVDAITVYDEAQQKNVISEEAKAALAKKLFDLTKVVNTLLADVPYELYWYDKTPGNGTTRTYSMSATSNALTAVNVQIKMRVAGAYNPDGVSGTFTVDTAKTSAVPAAVARAKDIRDEAAGMNDHEKLIYYKEQVCELTSYNYDAVNNNEPYGDPWQIISVFDGDPSTNVVCEGYSKSFKYLCDLSSFSDANIEALLMTGTMGGGTGAGRHMWNMVRMDDGLYYLADLTNCDSGTAGAPDKLFLAGSDDSDARQFAVPVSGTRSITYTYDDTTLALYSDAERTIAPHKYGSSYFIRIDTDEVRLHTGESADIPYTVVPAGTDPSLIIWSSTDTDVASVSGGTVTAVSPGECIIDAVIDNASASVSVIVTDYIPLTESMVEAIPPQTYTGEAVTPEITVETEETVLEAGTDYTVTFENNTDAGTASAVISGQGNYTGTVTVYFTIVSKTIPSAVTLSASSYTYDGSAKKPDVTVKDGDKTLVKGTDYTVSYKNNTNAGTASVTVTGKGNYSGTVTKGFTIRPKTVTPAAVLSASSYTYDGSAKKPDVTVKDGETVLVKGTDYTVSYKNNTDAGTASVTVTCKGNYTGTVTKNFTINKAAQTITAKAAAASVAAGKTTTVSVTGNQGTVSYKSSDTTIAAVSSAGKITAKKVGTVRITVTVAATDNYKAASKTVTVKVVPAAAAKVAAANKAGGIKIAWKKVTGATGYKIYRNGKLVKTVKSADTLSWGDTAAVTNGAKYTYKVVAYAATGDSTLSKSVTIYRLSQPKIASLANTAAGKLTVKWGKNAKATGYQIQYSASSKFTASATKTVTVTKNTTISKVISKLTKGKTYYVRVRSYKTVNGVKYYSLWSTAKKLKLTK